MIIEQDFRVGFGGLTNFNKLSNTVLLGFLEDAAGAHSNMVGLGYNDTLSSGFSWMILSWHVSLEKRPVYNDVIKIKTWCRKHERVYTYRDFEIFDSDGNVIGRATSKWVRVDLQTKKILPLDQGMVEKYGVEERAVFGQSDERLRCKCTESYNELADFRITKNLIDANGHLHNTYYLDVAHEVIPDAVLKSDYMGNFKILYKKEVKYGDNVKVLLDETPNSYVIYIENEDMTVLHAVITYYKTAAL